MKQIISILTFLFIFNITAFGQGLNKEIAKEGQKPFLLGEIDKKGLEGNNYSSWFTKNHDAYNVSPSNIEILKTELQNYEITLFMGTWCGDSKKEVPRLYKVLEASNFPLKQLKVIAVSREAGMYKQSPQHEEKGLNIHRVPTIIFYKNGKEVNRIVEHPVDSFEKDITNIVTKNNYISNYHIVTEIDNIIKKKGVKGLRKKSEKLIKTYKGQAKSMYELNTYARILSGTNKIEEAIEVFRFNTKLFPENSRTFLSLANTLGINGYNEKALETIENGLKLHPEDKALKEKLEKIKSK